jgi:hypothetical protein
MSMKRGTERKPIQPTAVIFYIHKSQCGYTASYNGGHIEIQNRLLCVSSSSVCSVLSHSVNI